MHSSNVGLGDANLDGLVERRLQASDCDPWGLSEVQNESSAQIAQAEAERLAGSNFGYPMETINGALRVAITGSSAGSTCLFRIEETCSPLLHSATSRIPSAFVEREGKGDTNSVDNQ